jgi:aminopeptidase N
MKKARCFCAAWKKPSDAQKFDKFVRGYFDNFAFQSITTETFVDYLNKNLLAQNPKVSRADVDEWIRRAGLPKKRSAAAIGRLRQSRSAGQRLVKKRRNGERN